MEKQEQKAYQAYVKKKAPKSLLWYDCLKAFWVGGLICVIGEAIRMLYQEGFSLPESEAGTWTSITLIFFGALLTGLGIYDKIGKYAGAGSVVPITGFANGIASPAMEYKPEGYVLGTGAKMFVIAGPVIVYGTCVSSLVGLIYYMVTRFL